MTEQTKSIPNVLNMMKLEMSRSTLKTDTKQMDKLLKGEIVNHNTGETQFENSELDKSSHQISIKRERFNIENVQELGKQGKGKLALKINSMISPTPQIISGQFTPQPIASNV